MDQKQDKKQKADEEVKQEEVIENPQQKEIEELKKSVEEMKNKYLRALADYQNFENRAREEKQQVREEATVSLLHRLVPFLDNLEQAEIFIKDKGLEMIRKQYMQALESIGIKEIDVMGKEFDPFTAEAIDIVEGEKENIVVEVLRKGYQYKDRILRPAQVKVSKKKVS